VEAKAKAMGAGLGVEAILLKFKSPVYPSKVDPILVFQQWLDLEVDREVPVTSAIW
jgi:hypothetical protein